MAARTLSREAAAAWRVHQNRAARLASTGHFEDAMKAARCALQIAHGAKDFHHPASMHLLVVRQGLIDHDFDLVEPLLRATLILYEMHPRHDRGDAAVMRGNLAWILGRLGRFEEAETLYLRALASAAKSLRRRPRTLATMLGNAASLYRCRGRVEVADALLAHRSRLQVKHQPRMARKP